MPSSLLSYKLKHLLIILVIKLEFNEPFKIALKTFFTRQITVDCFIPYYLYTNEFINNFFIYVNISDCKLDIQLLI